MENNVKNIQIVLSGNFEPFSANPNNIIEISTLLNEFQLFPKEVTEQRIEFTVDQKQNITLTKSLDLVSANQQNVLQVRPDMLIYNANIADISLSNIVDMFIKILNKVKDKVKFDKASRLGFVQTIQYLDADIQSYKVQNGLADEIIEHRNRTVIRQPLDKISELVNFVKANDFISKEAGAPQNILSYSLDINTVSDKDAARFTITDIKNFLIGATELLEG
ncbi:hypothetical protein [Acinetobacter sp. ANC 4173]|uniref:hypothetical protein n=1 Tax=Acinetobacter sp. ANC 4173 TaxID=2529837 RepID=UPI00103B5ACC|nr:hypothetical protein [Acinetobacter sp. ANC 4173]TCB73846.1 hypothetical protein E0H94_17880 [Acinetobacter sp. ANC 4173]